MYWYAPEQASRALDIYGKWFDLCFSWPSVKAVTPAKEASVSDQQAPASAPRQVAFRSPPQVVRAFAAPRPMFRGH